MKWVWMRHLMLRNLFLVTQSDDSQDKTFLVPGMNTTDFPFYYLNAFRNIQPHLLNSQRGVSYEHVIAIVCSSYFVDNFNSCTVEQFLQWDIKLSSSLSHEIILSRHQKGLKFIVKSCDMSRRTPRKITIRKHNFPLCHRVCNSSLAAFSNTQLTQCFLIHKRI